MQVVELWQATRNSMGVRPFPVRVEDGIVTGSGDGFWQFSPRLPLDVFKRSWPSVCATREEAIAEYRVIETARLRAAQSALASL